MTVSVARDGAIMLEGNCPLEDAEPLLQLLRRHPGEPVDWRRCNALHTAIVQVLMAAQPRIAVRRDRRCCAGGSSRPCRVRRSPPTLPLPHVAIEMHTQVRTPVVPGRIGCDEV